MKIHAYRVEVQNGPPMGTLLRQIVAVPFEERLRDTTAGRVRLDEITPAGSSWFLDFVKHRDGHGPGIASAADRVSGLQLRDGQTFAEETAAIFDENTGYMLIQYNHHGPRFGAIEDYLTGFIPRPANPQNDLTGVRLGIVLRDDAYVRLQQKPIVKSVEFAISVLGVRQADREAGRSLSAVLDAPLPAGLRILTVRMSSSAERGEQLDRGTVMEIVDNLRQFGGEVRRLFVKAKDNERARSEGIDLLKDRLEVEVNIPIGADRRYPQRRRWNALGEQYHLWRASGSLPV